VITLASQQLWIGIGIVGFLFVSLTMIMIVLIQKPQGGGLSGAFGSSSDGGSGQTAFGAKTGDVLTTMTIAIFVVFLLTAAGLNYLIRPPATVDEPTAATTTSTDGSDSTPTPATEPQPFQITPGEGPPPVMPPQTDPTDTPGDPDDSSNQQLDPPSDPVDPPSGSGDDSPEG
jgi:preprotein translocase subunit SecG